MAQIKARRQADGTLRYTAVIRIREGTLLLHQEAKTFALRSHAEKWAKHREVELEDPSHPLRKKSEPRTLTSLIRWYIDTFQHVSKWQRSKQTHLEFREHHAIGKCNALALTCSQLIKPIQGRRAAGSLRVTSVAAPSSFAIRSREAIS